MKALINSFFKIGSIEAGSRVLSWLTPFILATLLPTKQYGLVTILIAIENIGLAFYIAGLDKAMLKFGVDLKIKQSLIKNSLYIWALNSIIVTLLAISISYVLRSNDLIIKYVLEPPELMIFLIGIAFVALNRIHNAQCRVMSDTKGYLYSRLVAQIARLILILSVILLIDDATGYIYGTFAFFVIVFFQLLRNSKISSHKEIKKKTIFLFSWPYVPHMLAGSVIAYSDKIILQNYVSLDAIGSYGFAYLAGSAITFIYGVMASFFEPYFYKKNTDKSRLDPVVYSSVQIFIGLITGFILIELLDILGFANKYNDFLRLSPIILSAYLFHPIYLSGNYLLAKNGRSGLIASGTFISGSITILTNIILVPHMGVLGSAVACIFGFGSLSLYIGVLSKFLGSTGTKKLFVILNWVLVACLSASLVLEFFVHSLVYTAFILLLNIYIFYTYFYKLIRDS